MADLRYPNYVNQGGTGRSSHTAYAVICGGTTTTAEQQSVASLGTSGQVLTSNGAGALPTFQDVTAGVSGPVSSTDNALSRWNGTGGDTLQDSTVIVSDDGEMTNASQPAFNAYRSGDLSNLTGDGTVYTIIFNAELFDQTSDFDTTTGIFTAPITGKYWLNTNVTLTSLISSDTRLIVNIVAGGQTSTVFGGDPGSLYTSDNRCTVGGSMFIEMTSGSTAYVTVAVSGATKTVGIQQFYTEGTNFQGYLVC